MFGHLLTPVLLVGAPALAPEPFALNDGDTVALVGNTFVEREQRDGYLELALTLSAPEADVTFRNLGWSGDTVRGRARRFFGATEEGFRHLLAHLDLVAPSVILVSYGTNEAFDGPEGRADFLDGYAELLDALQGRTARIALVTSPPLDPADSPAPELARRVNVELAWQAERLRELAQERGLAFVDLFGSLKYFGAVLGSLTDNGVHLTPLGYRVAAAVILSELGVPAPAAAQPGEKESLRRAIVAKNALFFHRHRPQNETYLRGFRRHEQGKNAGEIQAFGPLVEQMDDEIFALRTAAVGRPR